MTIKSLAQGLTRFSLVSLMTAASARLLISYASWFRFFSAINFSAEPIYNVFRAASWQMTHGNAFVNWMHGIWLGNHVAFKIAMHWATYFMGFAALILLLATILEIGVWALAPRPQVAVA